MDLLQVKNLKVNYGPIQAVKGINMTIQEGSIVALLGANGAGKTTTLRTISGVVKASGGQILLDGVDVTNKKAYKIAAMGLNQSPEGRLVFYGLNVEDNLKAGAYGLKTKFIEKDGKPYSIKNNGDIEVKNINEINIDQNFNKDGEIYNIYESI